MYPSDDAMLCRVVLNDLHAKQPNSRLKVVPIDNPAADKITVTNRATTVLSNGQPLRAGAAPRRGRLGVSCLGRGHVARVNPAIPSRRGLTGKVGRRPRGSLARISVEEIVPVEAGRA